ncbi:LLM class flavin-dependent oxidoreductase [Nonomuraea roseoviolacea]|uniref:Alkanesulfonate monooxygenase SsuD/methylene tetrahydromethanopterin reductase-like flavin-dependent oxidoreductase (Luciferase family) n=1 Tax=Nonomuraea roseoviolacea subsp. carminata TaxID=160689 RepID=A0ABT1JXK5_9ACTN|nr:LLM class flavin-dependent oxidoreductase [Nonomuraea roseoviolacea]MCP2346486.1 alkanesulfonate monooxygenase SsuD/methylene tetrahydromethanopterin reductase-like flavin-dependent oxidoreductase (luciferase family) [Nonomuraea roseoviolacea subsp. carminata]
MTTPLSVLDLSPIPSGASARDALRNTLDLARRAEELGYHRYWLAEHHLAAGVASSAPAVLIGLVAAATSRIRVGSGAVQLGHQTALAVVEQFGLIEALHPGRVDLGLGRSGHRDRAPGETPVAPPEPVSHERRVVDGLLIPPPFDFRPLIASPWLTFQASLLKQPGGRSPAFPDQVDDILAFLRGEYRAPDGRPVHAVPGEGADVEVWVLGSSGGESARVAGERGLPFAANYHVSPASVLEAVAAYREAFKPSEELARPYVIVSADVLVAPDDATAAELAEPYGLWVRDIRTGAGAPPYPTPEQARAHSWTEEERALVADRIDTRFVGTPDRVAERLDVLRRVTGADELLVTTITHDHADRVRSYELLAAAWRERRRRHEGDARAEGAAA